MKTIRVIALVVGILSVAVLIGLHVFTYIPWSGANPPLWGEGPAIYRLAITFGIAAALTLGWTRQKA